MAQSIAPNESQGVQLEMRQRSSHETFKIRKLATTPSLHQDWGQVQAERRATWSELFSDLFYVVAAINLTHLVTDDPTAYGVGVFFLYATLFWTTWWNWTLMMTRFSLEGLLYDNFCLAHMIGVLGMTLHARTFDDKAGFAVCYMITRITLSLEYVIIFVFLERARPMSGFTVLVGLTTASLALITCFFNNNVFVVLMCVAIGIEMVGPFLVRFLPSPRNARVPLHVEHTAERFGLIMMVFLGETLNGIGEQYLAKYDRAVQYTCLALACVVVFCLHLMYYHVHPGQHQHALRISSVRGISWSFIHWILGICFLLCGAGIRLLLEEFHEPHVHKNSAWITCVPYSLSLHLMLLIRATHFLRRPNFLVDMGLMSYTRLWWALIALFPFATYFVPFAYEHLTSVELIAILAGHSLGINIVETAVTHTISSHPKFLSSMATVSESQSQTISHHTKGPHHVIDITASRSLSLSRQSFQVKISPSESFSGEHSTGTLAEPPAHQIHVDTYAAST